MSEINNNICSFNIIEIMKNNPLRQLSINYQNKFINKIQQEFTTEEQHIFISNFYSFLHYKKDNDYIIELDDIWKWLGFSRKDPAKRLLEKNFEKDKDYIILLNIKTTANNSITNNNIKNLGGAGSNKETILMNIKTFKKLCLKAKTKKADIIHDYYIKLEEILMSFVHEELDELKEQFDNINIQLKENKNEYNNYRLKTIKEKENTLLEIFDYKSLIYLIHIEDNLYKFGLTDNIKTRFNSHKKNIGEYITLIYCIESNDNMLLESNLKDYLFTTDYGRNKLFNDINYTELFEINNIEIIKNILIDFNNNLNTNKLLIKVLKDKIKKLQNEQKK
jgi:hypothetical protein